MNYLLLQISAYININRHLNFCYMKWIISYKICESKKVKHLCLFQLVPLVLKIVDLLINDFKTTMRVNKINSANTSICYLFKNVKQALFTVFSGLSPWCSLPSWPEAGNWGCRTPASRTCCVWWSCCRDKAFCWRRRTLPECRSCRPSPAPTQNYRGRRCDNRISISVPRSALPAR